MHDDSFGSSGVYALAQEEEEEHERKTLEAWVTELEVWWWKASAPVAAQRHRSP